MIGEVIILSGFITFSMDSSADSYYIIRNLLHYQVLHACRQAADIEHQTQNLMTDNHYPHMLSGSVCSGCLRRCSRSAQWLQRSALQAYQVSYRVSENMCNTLTSCRVK